jgi:hypothetical protein
LERFASQGAKATVNASLGEKATDADSTILDEQSAELRPLEEASVAGLSDSFPPPPSLFSAKASASPNSKASASPNSKALASPGSKAIASPGSKTWQKQGIADNNLQELAGVKQSPLELSTLPVLLSVNKERADENHRTNVLLHKSTDSVSKTVLFGTKEDIRAMRKASKSILIVDDSSSTSLSLSLSHTHITHTHTSHITHHTHTHTHTTHARTHAQSNFLHVCSISSFIPPIHIPHSYTRNS